MALVDENGLPLGIFVDSASPHEVKLVEATLNASFLPDLPKKVIGDKAYDSDPLDEKLQKELHIELIAPHRSNRKRPKTQDGRKLRPYGKRWLVERFFAWIQNCRRVLVRHEIYPENYRGMVLLACLLIFARRL